MAETGRELSWEELHNWILSQIRNQRLMLFAEQGLAKIMQAEGVIADLSRREKEMSAKITDLVSAYTLRAREIEGQLASRTAAIEQQAQKAGAAAQREADDLIKHLEMVRQQTAAEEEKIRNSLASHRQELENVRQGAKGEIEKRNQVITDLDLRIKERQESVEQFDNRMVRQQADWKEGEEAARARIADLDKEFTYLKDRLRRLGE